MFKPTKEKNGGEETEMAVYVGIDVHKNYCQAALMNDNGHVVQELRFDNTSEGASSLVTLARSIDPHMQSCCRTVSQLLDPNLRSSLRMKESR